jgi:hypothetical protein
MTEPTTAMALAAFALIGFTMLVAAALKGWQGWLELKRLELTGSGAQRESAAGASMTELIEMAALRERIRKLESIAACVDL